MMSRIRLDPLIGGGNVAYCSPSGSCHSATTTTTLKFPNGLTKGKDGLVYVPSSVDGSVRVFELQSDKTLKLLDTIHLNMPLDNISPDASGDLWVPGFPNFVQGKAAIENPSEKESPSTIWRIKKTNTGYEPEKVLEDNSGEILSIVTTVRHDSKTGRLFMGSKSL
jgi:WD40 repeat protein